MQNPDVIPSVSIKFPLNYFGDELSPNPLLFHEVPKLTVLVTHTSYKVDKGLRTMNSDNELRAGLALKMMKYARELGYEVVCVDSNSDRGWRQEVKDLKVRIVDEDLDHFPGGNPIGRCRRQAFFIAGNLSSRYRFMGWLEPEKHPFVLMNVRLDEEGVKVPVAVSPLAMALTPLYEGLADAIVPRRIDHLASYPPQAQMEELMSNITYMESLQDFLIKRNQDLPPTAYSSLRVDPTVASPYLDMQFGPKVWRMEVLDYLLKYPGKILVQDVELDRENLPRKIRTKVPHDRWEATFMPFWWMILDGKTVRGVAVPYEHPEEQTKAEYGQPSWNRKRIDQAQSITGGLQSLLDNFELNKDLLYSISGGITREAPVST